MLILLAVLAAVVLALMTLKLARAVRESRAASAGYITFGGDDRYQARNVRRTCTIRDDGPRPAGNG